MPKPKPTQIDPRQVLPGHIIRSKTSDSDEVVRGVSVIVHLANGFDEVYEIDETVGIVPPAESPKPLPDNLKPVAPPEGE